jgi:hypothetical protein
MLTPNESKFSVVWDFPALKEYYGVRISIHLCFWILLIYRNVRGEGSVQFHHDRMVTRDLGQTIPKAG